MSENRAGHALAAAIRPGSESLLREKNTATVFIRRERRITQFGAQGVGLACRLACLIAVAALASTGAVAEVSLVDQGWRIVDRDGTRLVELSALVGNSGPSSVRYQVRFLVERYKRSCTLTATGQTAAYCSLAQEPWAVVKTIVGETGSLAPGTSVSVTADLPYDELSRGTPYRFRAELADPEMDLEPPKTEVMRPVDSAMAFGTVALAVPGLHSLGGSKGGTSGQGTMSGQHEAHRVNGEWVENGSGTIEMGTSEGHLHLEYSYTARGPSAAALSATATATGTLLRPDDLPAPVEITSASATMSFPGFRRGRDQILRRSGATATGTFSGTVGDTMWDGVLTLRDGTYTLDPATGRGEHEFQIQLLRATSATAPVAAAGDPGSAGER